MAVVTGDRYLESLVKFVENQAEKLIEGTLVLKLNPVGLRYVQSRLEALAELESLLAGAPVDYLRAYVSDLGDHRALEQLRRILRLLPSLKVVSVLPPPGRDPTPLYLLPFGRLKVLELRGCDLSTSAAKGLLELRFTLEKFICYNSTDALRHVFASRIADIKDSPQWNRLSFVSCACNSLLLMDESLQLLPVVETLDLSRNKFARVDNLRKCTKLKHVDLGFNNLRSVASFSKVSAHIVKLVLRNNALTSLHGIENLKSLQGLDLSYNIISKFSDIEILAGLPFLQNLWLEGNPLCYARWFRAQVFSLFAHPDQLTLDDKKISRSEFWKWQIIIASRQKQPASFGFYSPVRDDADVEGSINTKRKQALQKRASRLVSIENDERVTYVCSDQDSLSCDNEIQSKEENAYTDNEAEIEDLMKKIEYMKKDHSVLWLQEFKEWMDQTSENFLDGNKLRSTILHDNKEIHLKSETKDEDLAETSRYISDSFQPSGDESSTIILESETSFADTSTVVSGQRYFDRPGETASKLFMGHSGGDRAVFKNFHVNQEELRLLNDEGNVSAEAGDSHLNSLREDNVSTENIISSSTAINDIMESHSSSACPGSPPHYQEDILHRRQNLEEEFLQLSAESFSVASSDSNTSCSEDESAEFGPSVSHGNQSVISNSSERSMSSSFVSAYQDDSADVYPDKISLLKQNGTHSSSICAEEKFSSTDHTESEISALACSSSISDGVCDDENLGFNKGKTDWLEKTKRKRKPRRRMISLPEEDDAHVDTDSSKKFNDRMETCQSDMVESQEICSFTNSWEATQPRNSEDRTTPAILSQCCRDASDGFNTSHGENDFIMMYFNSNVAHSGEISTKYVRCNCLFPKRTGDNEREVAILRSSEQKLYILLVDACDGSGTDGLEMVGCYGVGGVREVFVGLGLQVVRMCFEGNATYLFITRCLERSRELLDILDFFDSSVVKNPFSLTSLEQIQVNLFEEHVCGGAKINILQYSMVLFCQKNFRDTLWLPRTLFMLGWHLLLCTEDLMQFDPSENAFSPNYFSLDSCCAILDVSEMVIDTADCLCVSLTLECTSELCPSDKAYRIKNAFQRKEATSEPVMWRLKWFSKDSLLNFVALVKAIHNQATASSLRVRYRQ